ncbi:MAG: CHC2 zinc finger domain-containing protein, partial [Candidatus Aenigmatarchaeota archaeon]
MVDAKEITGRINLIDYIQSLGFVPSYLGTDRAMFYSPLREEENPSFYVSYFKDRWTWRDFGTGEHGDIINFVESYHGVDFKEALEILSRHTGLYSSSTQPRKRETREEKVKWLRNFYERCLLTTDIRAVEKYFIQKGVTYHPEMGCCMYYSFKDKKRYVGIPLPYPRKTRGLEMREFGGSSRKTYGYKTLWLLVRDRSRSRMLITESVLDCLAGEKILGIQDATLCSLNGVGNIVQLPELFRLYKPSEVLFALDGDDPGRKAQREAIAMVPHGTRVVEVEDHVRAG